MKRRAIATLCAISTVAIAAPVSQNEIVNRYSDLHRFSGVVLEAKNGNITYQGARGFANLEFQIPNTLRTKFNLGSMAKQFVAAAILKLDQEGKLSVKDPIQKYISEYPSPQGQQVTIHQLLCHSSGIPSIGRRDGLADVDWDGNPTSLAKTIGLSWNLPLQFAPGSQYRYNNTGYVILALIIERVGKKPFDVWMRDNLFRPCGLMETEVMDGKSILSQLASGYQNYFPNYERPNYVHPTWQWGMAGVCSTALDMHHWMQVLQTTQYLDDAHRKLLFSHHIPRSRTGTYYGYGWFISPRDGRDWIWSGGTVEGFVCELYWLPNRNYWSLAFCNNPPQVGVDISDEILSQLLLREEGKPLSLPPKFIKLSPSDLRPLAGEYAFGGGMNLRLEEKAGALIATCIGTKSWSLATLSDQAKLDLKDPLIEKGIVLLRAFASGDEEAAKPLIAPDRRKFYDSERVLIRKAIFDKFGVVQEFNPIRIVKEGSTTTVAFRVSQSKEDRYVHFEFDNTGGLVGDYYANTLPSKLELKPESKMTFFVDGFPFESPDLRWKFETVSGTVYMVCLDHPELRAPRIAK